MRVGAVAAVMMVVMAVAQPVRAGVTKVAAATKCPGAFRADQHDVGGARTVWTVAFEDQNKKDQWWPASGSMGVHVVFQDARVATRTLEFSVSYLPPGVRAGSDASSAQELKKNYSLPIRDKVLVQGDLLVGPASAVTRVHLVSATFADGSVWHAASDDACSIEPNRVIAVDGKESSIKW